jgi:hypothetical protein
VDRWWLYARLTVHSTVRLFLVVDHPNAIAARYTADADRCVVDESKLLRLEGLHQQDVQKGSHRLTSEVNGHVLRRKSTGIHLSCIHTRLGADAQPGSGRPCGKSVGRPS